MTFVTIAGGLYFPNTLMLHGGGGTAATIDAATEKFAGIGHLYIDGRPTSSKTLSSSGGAIQFRTGAVTWANGGSSVDIGIQDVVTGAGPIVQPDGTFDCKASQTGGDGSITGNAWKIVNISTGTKTMSHGDLIAVVWDLTARAGTDSIILTSTSPIRSNQAGMPNTNAFVSSAWQTTTTIGANQWPNVVITFDDGTLGTIDGTHPWSSQTSETWADATTPDERGMMFTASFNCKIDAFWIQGGVTDANSDFTLKLYSDPTGTPSLITSLVVRADQMGQAAANSCSTFLLPTEITLDMGAVYGVTVLATGTTNTRLVATTLGNTAHRCFIAGSTNLGKISRDGSTGAFSAESPALTIYNVGVRVSQIDDGASQPTYMLGI